MSKAERFHKSIGQRQDTTTQPSVLSPEPSRLDVAGIRARLEAARGPHYWRSLEELADTEEFQAFLHSEFPEPASQLTDSIGRRNFLKIMGASLALAGLSACTRQPLEQIFPYTKAPEEIIPGKPLFFATAMSMSGAASALLVESHMGRPTKIEGNPDHPASLGATDLFAQASVLTLYDPDRSEVVTNLGDISTWTAFLAALNKELENQQATRGAGLRVLTETVNSPTLARQLQELLSTFPSAKWHQYEPVSHDHARAGARLAFGEYVDAQYRFDKADVILALDADFLFCGPGTVRYARDFADRRRLLDGQAQMNRLYIVESTPSVTGTLADHRLPLRASKIENFARAVAKGLGVNAGSVDQAALDQTQTKWIDALVRDLQTHRGSSLIVVGDQQPPAVHALAHAMNHALGNVGTTVIYTDPVQANPVQPIESLRDLANDMESGAVEMLVIIGGNPVFTAPADLQFAERMSKVAFRVHLSLYDDETSVLCHWHVPQTHYLESWSDARAYDGTVSIIQPLIAPLYSGSQSAHELVAALLGKADSTGYDIVRDYWKNQRGGGSSSSESQATGNQTAGRQTAAGMPNTQAGRASTQSQAAASAPGNQGGGMVAPNPEPTSPPDFERFWRTALHDGLIAGTALPAKPVTLNLSAVNGPSSVATDHQPQRTSNEPPATNGRRTADNGPSGNGPSPLEIVFRPDPTIWDGRFANNGWLQELPKPMTKLTWDNVAVISPTAAERFDLTNGDLVELRYGGRTVVAPVWIMPGQAPDSVTVHLGYGRTRAGRVGTGVGFNAYTLRTSDAPWFGSGLELRKTGNQYQLAGTQNHFSLEGRNMIRAATLDEYRKNPNFAQDMGENPPPDRTLYPQFRYEGNAWGMAIDLNACTGCNACVVACQAENNVAVVGKGQVALGREMHWLRVDRYYQGHWDNPDVYTQPMLCQHCEIAPCEVVCPVAATTHSAEGLNQMVYNRCVGTRYCSNNCPYKVRRFNFLLYSDWTTPSLKLQRNPDVTVRSRGVMEKCTYCVQRINAAKIEAEKEDREVRDGEIVTACQAACPTQAIVFGNINDPNSRVSKLKAQPRNYGVLAELNTRPRTTYLARVTNPNPELLTVEDRATRMEDRA
jgi:molybdopterin-containing oxidoreductase family iron-sulfur binding subunit